MTPTDPPRRVVPGPSVKLGRYECLVPLAEGGMATVWAARLHGARGFERLVAVKTISAALAEDPAFSAMFLDEAHFASRIRHPNVVSVLDLGEIGDLLYLVMEWVDGEPLSGLMREAHARGRGFPLPIIGRLMLDVCAGLEAAHAFTGDDGVSVGLVHRDVSPQNVMVSRDGHVKLLDFGLAKATLLAGERTQPGHTKGKLGFMAPEQALGEQLDRRADLFPVGVMMFQLLTGKHPFRAHNTMATLQRLLTAALPTPRSLCPSLPDDLDAVVARAMAREPGGRPSSAAELGDELSRALAGEVATSAEVAAFVEELVGERLADRQRRLRVAMARSDAPGESEPPPPESGAAPKHVPWLPMLSSLVGLGPAQKPTEAAARHFTRPGGAEPGAEHAR